METSGDLGGSGDPLVDIFLSPHGYKLSSKYWNFGKSNRTARCLVFISHGVMEHAMYYDEMARKLAEYGCLSFAHDHVGHGLSDGDRVHIDDFSIYCDDVVSHVKKVKDEHPELPCFIIGHSMGGTIAIMTALQNPDMFAGVVLISPGILPDDKNVSFFKLRIFLARVSASITPQLQVASSNPDWISRDPDEVKRYKEDPLVWHGGAKAKWVCCMIDTMQYICDHFHDINFPYLLIHGTEDKICLVDGSILMQEKSSSKDKTSKIFPGAYHQVHTEPDGVGVQAVQDMIDWIFSRSSNTTSP